MRPSSLLISLMLVLGACAGDDEPVAGSSPTGGSGRTDGGAGSSADGGAPGGSPDFAQCGASSFEAKRGLRAANVVWVVDTSGSMDEEAALVQRNLNQFVSQLVGAGLEDYRMVVLSERSYVTVPEPLASDTTHFRYVEEEVGSNEPLQDLRDRHGDYGAFLLPGVVTHFVVVTDDESDLPANDFVIAMKSKLQGDLRVHAIASPPGETRPSGGGWFDDDEPKGCVGPHGDAEAPGVEHYAAAMQTMGLTFSICQEDWTGLFSQLASAVGSSAAIPCTLDLPKPAGQTADPSLINVVLKRKGSAQGRTIPRVMTASACGGEGWYYDDPAQPQKVVLCPQSCGPAVQESTLEIAVGCSTVLR